VLQCGAHVRSGMLFLPPLPLYGPTPHMRPALFDLVSNNVIQPHVHKKRQYFITLMFIGPCIIVIVEE